MQKKSRPSKKGAKKTPASGGRIRKTLGKRGQSQVTMLNRSGNFQYAERFFTKLVLTVTGTISAAQWAANAGTTNGFAFSMNNLKNPLLLSSYASGSGGIFTAGNSAMVPNNGSLGSTAAYNGYTQLQSMYTLYRIHASRIKAKMCPTSTADSLLMEVACVPWNAFDDTGVTGAYPIAPQNFVTFNNHKSVVCRQGDKDNEITQYVKTKNVLGWTKTQYDAYPAVNYATSATNSVDDCIWILQYSNVNSTAAGVLAGEVGFEMSLECWIELSGPIPVVQ